MAKIDNRPKENMQLTIEFADNGIILRNPECEDEIKLAVTGYGDTLYDEEYKAIGQKILDWLLEVVVPENADNLIVTGAELDITATMTGRKR